MNWTRAGIIAFVALCTWAAWPKGQIAAPPRPLLIKAALKDANDPVVILGDSIIEFAALPRLVCGRSLINAGIGGSTSASGLDAMLIKAIGSKRPAMIVVSLGINDAAKGFSIDTYKSNYRALLNTLKPVGTHLAVAAITSIDPGPSQTSQVDAINSYNAILPIIAQEAGAGLLAIPPMPAQHTTDGVHLNAEGYKVWTKALIEGIEITLCKAK